MREYLYIDDVEINSLLAQQNKGVTTSKTVTESNSNTLSHSTTTGGEASGGGEGKIPFLAKAEGSLALHYNSTKGENIENTDQTAISTVLNDYIVTLLEKDLQGKMKRESDDITVGDVANIIESPKLYDFETIFNSTDHGLLKKVMKVSEEDDINEVREEYRKAFAKNPSAKKQLKNKQNMEIQKIRAENTAGLSGPSSINLLGEYGKKVFPNTIILAGKDCIAYTKIENYRMNATQLNSIANSPRKMHILGIIENKLTENPLKSGTDDISQIGSSIANILLFSFSIAEVGMFVIKPLAMYYEI
ncbi:hypothetical protein QFX17_08430 [Lactobacillus helveticus]|uniref:DUF6414 family protein n=1 Tax=Lactobacillus helveticus TaxID=1587 RepID=UPI0021A7CF78|nr:hypothetical protein [Lactobacillus helveticus]MCP9317504.1 hypothetical protein [Lactobacillus helveticus]MCT3401879.1 hypothetical protein [Lactobacillus helveticus]MDH5818225.1 hypothetical protein [Lactobacillus helveticus]